MNKDDVDPEEEKRRNIESTLSIKFHSYLDKNLDNFLDRIAMKIETRRYNINMLFMAYICYDTRRYSQVCDKHVSEGNTIPSASFMSEAVEWLLSESQVRRWYLSFSKVKSYTLRNFCYDIAYNIVIVSSEINSDTKNYDIGEFMPDDDDEFVL